MHSTKQPTYIEVIFFLIVGYDQGRSQPPASLGTSPGSAPTFFVASSAITITFSFSCGFTCRFCQGFRFTGEVYLRILGSAGNVKLSAGNVKLFAGRK